MSKHDALLFLQKLKTDQDLVEKMRAQDKEGATLECDTDGFSTFMIAYKDKDATKGTSSNSSGKATAKTGDNVPVVFLAMLALVAGALLPLAATRRREQ